MPSMGSDFLLKLMPPRELGSTTIIFRFTDIIFCWYLHSKSVNTYFTDGLMNENKPSEKISSVIYGLSVI